MLDAGDVGAWDAHAFRDGGLGEPGALLRLVEGGIHGVFLAEGLHFLVEAGG